MAGFTPPRPAAGIATGGVSSFRCVDLASGAVLVDASAGRRTADAGAFLAVAAARYILKHRFTPLVIYTDSTTALSWYRSGRAAIRRRSPDILRAEVFLRLMAVPLAAIELRHWNTLHWGENPADFGEK